MVVGNIKIGVHAVVFIDRSQSDRLCGSADIAAHIVKRAADSSVERGTDIAIAQIGVCSIQSGFGIADCCSGFGYIRFSL